LTTIENYFQPPNSSQAFRQKATVGAWGSGILQNDTVADVVGFITDRLKAGDQLQAATAAAITHFAELEHDRDDAPLLWLAIAHMQWKYGSVDPKVLIRVRNDIEAERGLDLWRDDPKSLSRRKGALARFLGQIEQPNPKPSALPKLIVRRAPFRQGDCLAVLLPDGRYTAALVLAEDNTNPEYGMNLIASLDYCESVPPSLSVFEQRKWLVLSHGNWNNERDICWYLPVRFQSVRKRITIVGNVRPKWSDPKESRMYAGWNDLGLRVLLCRQHEAKQNA
jgi:hypothetical protein